jgi:hypothetical protein
MQQIKIHELQVGTTLTAIEGAKYLIVAILGILSLGHDKQLVSLGSACLIARPTLRSLP